MATRDGSTPFTTRRGCGRLRGDHERLHLDGERPAPLERDRDARAAHGVAGAAEEEARGVGHLGDAVAGHLEASDLVGGAEAVLEGAHESERRLPIALELAHDVDEVLEQARPRDRAVFRDVADEEHGQLPVFRDPDERRRDLAHLARLAGQAVGQRTRHGLHGVDDEQLWAHLVDLAEDRGEIGLGGEVELTVECARAAGPESHLRHRLLGAHVEHPPAGRRHPGGDFEQERGLADARLAREQDRRARDDAAAEHAVELADAARAVCGIFGVDLADRSGRPRRARRDGLQRAHDAGLLGDVDDGAPLLAFGAAPRPLRGGPPAFRASERGDGAGHALSVAAAPDIRRRCCGVAAGGTLNACERTSTSSSSGPARPVSP